MKCYKCGAEVPSGKMSCDNCGAMIFSNIEERKDVSNMQFTLPEVSQGGGAGLAVASMVLGIVSLVLFWTILVPLVCGIVSIALGGYSLYTKRRGRGMAIAGLSCGIVALGLGCFLALLWFWDEGL